MSPETVTAAATVLTFCVAVVALLVAMHQIRVSREIAAYDAYEEYHHFILQHPELGAGGFHYESAESDDRRRYEVFVMSMLLTAERVLALFPRSADWRAALLDDINLHLEFIASEAFQPLRACLNPKVDRLIDEALRKHRQT